MVRSDVIQLVELGKTAQGMTMTMTVMMMMMMEKTAKP